MEQKTSPSTHNGRGVISRGKASSNILTIRDEALALATARQPDLLLLDVLLPTIDGLAVCRQLKAEPALPCLPILMISAKTATPDIIAGFEAGADDYLPKPVDQAVLVVRVQALLRRKALHDAAQAQAAEATAWSQRLEQRVQAQMAELARLRRLKPFVSPPLAEVVVTVGGEHLLPRQQREVTVVCCALHGFAVLAATAARAQVVECSGTTIRSWVTDCPRGGDPAVVRRPAPAGGLQCPTALPRSGGPGRAHGPCDAGAPGAGARPLARPAGGVGGGHRDRPGRGHPGTAQLRRAGGLHYPRAGHGSGRRAVRRRPARADPPDGRDGAAVAGVVDVAPVAPVTRQGGPPSGGRYAGV
jgi:CheY-like chemotaxis protein